MGNRTYGRCLAVVLLSTLLTACDSPEANDELKFEIQKKILMVLKGLNKEQAEVPLDALFDPVGIGICIAGNVPRFDRLEEKSAPEFHRATALLEAYNEESPSSEPEAEYNRVYTVAENEVLKVVEVYHGSAILVVSGSGCYRYSDIVTIGGPSRIKASTGDMIDRVSIEFPDKQRKEPAAAQ